MKQKTSQTSTRASDYQFRRLTARLGSSLCREPQRRGLVSTGNSPCTSTASSNFSSQDLPEGSLRDISAQAMPQQQLTSITWEVQCQGN